MELFHVHLLNNKDNLYKEGNTINVNPEVFNNRIYDRINSGNANVSVKDYPNAVNQINQAIKNKGYDPLTKYVCLGDLSMYFRNVFFSQVCLGQKTYVDPEELIGFLTQASETMLAVGTNYREMALEEYRKENCPDKPSRLHSMFACSEAGIKHWVSNIHDGERDVYRIEVDDNPFVSNDMLLPDEDAPYGLKVKQAARYFKPKQKDLDPLTDEYLVQGKVKILEKVMEIRQPKH